MFLSACLSTNFKFGDGWKVASIEKVTIPATISEQPVRIRTDVVREEITLLLSKKSIKKAETNVDFKTDTVSMFGSQQELIITSSGHYAVPLGQRARMDKIKKGDLKVMLVAKTICIKACVRYFLSMFIFSSSNRPSKTMKNVFYFILKALFVFKIFKFL